MNSLMQRPRIINSHKNLKSVPHHDIDSLHVHYQAPLDKWSLLFTEYKPFMHMMGILFYYLLYTKEAKNTK
jgi:hypothetical protein